MLENVLAAQMLIALIVKEIVTSALNVNQDILLFQESVKNALKIAYLAIVLEQITVTKTNVL